MIDIFNLSTLTKNSDFEEILSQIRFIFYTSSSLKEFSSKEKKEDFFKKWCGDYLTYFPEEFFIMFENNKVLGYLSGCQNSKKAMAILEVPGFNLFSDLFDLYLAHFHINFHPDYRGLGLGERLVTNYINDLKEKNIHGLHIITAPGAKNITFYKKLGLQHEVKRNFKGNELLFMGKQC